MLQDDTVVYSFHGPMGVRVDVGQSIAALIVFLVLLSGGAVIDSMIFATILFASIYLHELGHAWGCKVQGISVRRILLHGGGGLCERSRSATAYEQELIVAMGPIVNLAIWAVASLMQWWMWSNLGNAAPSALFLEMSYILWTVIWLNLALVIFNMIPVQPLDGGKLLHLILLRMAPADVAQRVTGGVGLILSVAWIPAAIYAYLTFGWILFFLPSIPAHYRMVRGQLA